MQHITTLIKTIVPQMVLDHYSKKRDMAAARRDAQVLVKQWEASGKPVPAPHVVKQAVVEMYARKYHVRVLVETGTYKGAMVTACKNQFGKIISIELDRELYEKAKALFAADSHISICLGDSSELLPELLEAINVPCLFWLDGHYSGGVTAKSRLSTPIMEELKCIFSHNIKSHIILIDDARCFTGADDYPVLDDLESFALQHGQDYHFLVQDDIIRLVPFIEK